MKLADVMAAIELLRKEGWTVEPPRKLRGAPSNFRQVKRVGRPPKNGRRKRGRPPKQQAV